MVPNWQMLTVFVVYYLIQSIGFASSDDAINNPASESFDTVSIIDEVDLYEPFVDVLNSVVQEVKDIEAVELFESFVDEMRPRQLQDVIPKRYHFSWPYNPDNSCRCEEAVWGEHESEADCLTEFALSTLETCIYGAHGASIDDCNYAVSTDTALTNDVCNLHCIDKLNGDNNPFFDNSCKIELYYVHAGKVRTSDECFDRYIYGYDDSNYDAVKPAFYDYFENVHTAAACQNLCQQDDGCDSWYWRRFPVPMGERLGQHVQNFNPYTCFLKDAQMVYEALRVPKEKQGLHVGNSYWAWCDLEKFNKCQDIYLNAWGEEQCLRCECLPECVWKSDEHISGPKFCAPSQLSICRTVQDGPEQPPWKGPEQPEVDPPEDDDDTPTPTPPTIDDDTEDEPTEEEQPPIVPQPPIIPPECKVYEYTVVVTDEASGDEETIMINADSNNNEVEIEVDLTKFGREGTIIIHIDGTTVYRDGSVATLLSGGAGADGGSGTAV